jgi:hypothetical protein
LFAPVHRHHTHNDGFVGEVDCVQRSFQLSLCFDWINSCKSVLIDQYHHWCPLKLPLLSPMEAIRRPKTRFGGIFRAHNNMPTTSNRAAISRNTQSNTTIKPSLAMLEMTTVIVDDDERYKENHCSIIH